MQQHHRRMQQHSGIMRMSFCFRYGLPCQLLVVGILWNLGQ
jgi:hypothetical protein